MLAGEEKKGDMELGAPETWRTPGRRSRTRRQAHRGNSRTVRIRIKTLPALRYEGFDLSSYQVGQTYEVEGRLADLLVERGYAEPEVCSDNDHATNNEVDVS